MRIVALLIAFASAAEPARINKAIELLSEGKPVYYTVSRGGYDEGKALAHTWADYINYELEHGAFDVTQLRAFMQGLADGGPTPSGHRTPAVIVSIPALGIDEASMRANSWVIQQVLAAGAHGVILCRARTAGAVRAFVQAARYPFHKQAVGDGLEEGLRGSGSQDFAATIWGISRGEYLRVADPWPLNPDGEILLGLKIEDRHALDNAEATTRVAGVGFAEWGPGDMSFSFGFPERPRELPPVLVEARARVLAATKAAGIFFLNSVTEENVEAQIDEGVMIGAASEAAAIKGRRYSREKRP